MNIGMNFLNGLRINDLEHLRQSIAKVLTTPVGSRVQRRSFGSLLPELIDQPLNDYLVIQLYAATATALLIHEPRFRLSQAILDVSDGQQGRGRIELQGVALLDALTPVTLNIDL